MQERVGEAATAAGPTPRSAASAEPLDEAAWMARLAALNPWAAGPAEARDDRPVEWLAAW